MGVFTYENEIKSTVATAKLYKALVLESDKILPKALEACQSVEILEGSGGPGTLKKITFAEGGNNGHVLHKVQAGDEANFAYKYSIVGGSGLPAGFEKISFECKLVATADGGCVGKNTVKYFAKGDAPPGEEELKVGKARDEGLFKAVEAYVLANP